MRDPSACGKDDDQCGEGSKADMCSVVEQFPGFHHNISEGCCLNLATICKASPGEHQQGQQ